MRFSTLWRNKFLTADAKSIDDMIIRLQAAAAELKEMKKAGIRLEEGSDMAGDYADLITDDPVVAKAFCFDDEEDEEDGFIEVKKTADKKQAKKNKGKKAIAK